MTLAEKIGELLAAYDSALRTASRNQFAEPYYSQLQAVQVELVEILRTHLQPRNRPEYLLFHGDCYQVCYRTDSVSNTCARTEHSYEFDVPYVPPLPTPEEVSAESASVLSV
jgi:hypothetical protein